jgi:hypothetical protein
VGAKAVNNNQVVNFSTEQSKTMDPQRFVSLNKQAAESIHHGGYNPYGARAENQKQLKE